MGYISGARLYFSNRGQTMATDFLNIILNFVLQNLEGILGLLGIGGLSTQIMSVVSFFDSNNKAVNTAPSILKLFQNVRTWTMSPETLAQIKAAVSSTEVAAVVNSIALAQEARKATYNIETSVGTIDIAYGEVTNPAILTTHNRDGNQIGILSVRTLTINNTHIVNNFTTSLKNLIDKTCTATFTGKEFGTVVVGFFLDGRQFAENTCTTTPEAIEIVSANMPDHNSDYLPGAHALEIKQGYVSGYSSGDQVSWNEALTARYTINVISA